MDPKTLSTIWYTYMTLVTKYQISAINSYWEKCDENYLGRTDWGKTVYPPSGSGGIIIDESLILAIVSRNYSTKPSYIFQLKPELKVWKYIFNLFHFEVDIQNRNTKFRSLSLFVLTFHEYKACFVFGFRLDYKLFLFIFFLFCIKLFCVLFVCYNQYKLINSSDPR
jgi:hypothetical protein